MRIAVLRPMPARPGSKIRWGTAKTGQVLLACYLAIALLAVGWRGLSGIRGLSGAQSDFEFFRESGQLILSDGAPELYDTSWLEARTIDPARGRFAYPPSMAALYAPLGLVPAGIARAIYVAVSVLAVAAICSLVLAYCRSLQAAFGVLVVLSFWPVYETMRLGQPSLILAAVSGAGLACWKGGRLRLAGGLISVLSLKLPWLLAPAFLAAITARRRLVSAVAFGVTVLVIVPFLWLGPRTALNYLELLSASRYDAFHLFGRIHSGAQLMFNWNGFWGRLSLTDPSPLLVLPFYMATLLLMARVWSIGTLESRWTAGALATLLALPHALYYDWVLVLPPAIALAYSERKPGLLALLLALHLAVNISVYQIVPFNGDRAIIAAAPVGLLVLAYLALIGPKNGDHLVPGPTNRA